MGLFDSGADEANAFNQQQLQALQGLYGKPGSQNPNTLFGMLNQTFQRGQGFMEQGVGAVDQGYQQALASMGGAATGARSEILAREKRTQGNVSGMMADRGLYNTSAAGSAYGQVAGGATRELSNLASQQGQAMAGLHMQGGMARGSALSSLANFLAQKPRIAAGMGGALGAGMGQFQAQAGGSLFGQIAPALGFGLGSYFGSKGGGEK